MFILIWVGGGVAFFLSAFVLRRARITSNACAHCGYDLSATDAALPCPECGKPHAEERARLYAITAKSYVVTACCTWPFALLPASILAAHTDLRNTDAFDIVIFSLTALPYPLIQLGSFAIGRFQTTRATCLLNVCACVLGTAAHTLFLLDIFVWHPDALAGIGAMGAAAIVLPISGYGTLIGALILRSKSPRIT